MAAAWASATRQHAGQVIVADGTPEAARRLERVLTTDPGMGVVRHADAGYEEAIAAARRHGLDHAHAAKTKDERRRTNNADASVAVNWRGPRKA